MSATKTLSFANISPGTAHVICDVSGYYLA